MINSRALFISASIGTVLQLAMVFAGHSNKTVAGLFAAGGMGISLIAGAIYAVIAQSRGGQAAGGGAAAGAICALIGIAVSCALGDVPPVVLGFGTLSSAATGALGGFAAGFLARTGARAALVITALAMPRQHPFAYVGGVGDEGRSVFRSALYVTASQELCTPQNTSTSVPAAIMNSAVSG